jgi:hypothetical protein
MSIVDNRACYLDLLRKVKRQHKKEFKRGRKSRKNGKIGKKRKRSVFKKNKG